ncbi:MAG: phosphoribosylglycinamide formyltransferase [Rhodocyclaceae bacterium]|jgi:phosphoribosylglycinamide formyltransferase-1|nr:phosphoribosylglycinamide formyltransferase [Rhodocyclaceae bacterium]
MKNIVILISGRGSNMEAMLEAKMPCRIAAVISNKVDAKGLETARAHGISTAVVAHAEHASRELFDAALAAEIDRHAPDLVVLAGFMRILGEAFVRRYHGRLMNIHPSLLPAFPGLHTHRRALEAGCRIHGCTVHFVTPALDNGPVVIQAAVPVYPDDSENVLAARVLAQEHIAYPQAVRWLVEGRLTLGPDGRVRLDGERHEPGALLSPLPDAH